jgi:prepilin-type N-terminal cleavage/methylation domain-containing protein
VKRLNYTQCGFTPSQTGRPKAAVAVPSAGRFATGFTLIEVMLVLAIASLLAVILLNGYGKTRQRAQFNDAVERLVSNIDRAKTESNSTYTTGSGVTASRIFFGKAFLLTKDSGNFIIRNLTANRNESGVPEEVREEGTSSSDVIAWGATCQGDDCNKAIVFSRQGTDGLLNTYILDSSSLETLENESNYNSTADTSVLSLQIKSPEGYTATVTIDAGSNEVKRSFD